MKKQLQRAKSERGVALIMALIMILVLSVLVAGLVFATQTQTWTGFNYKNTTQARYAAEAGIQRTMNWIMSPNYTPPAAFGSFDMTKYPVKDTGAAPQPIVLSAAYGIASNYPTASVQTAFNGALNDQPVPGLGNATFSTYATLLKMTPGAGVSWFGGGAGGSPQTWQITSIGSVSGVRAANVQLQAIYERGSTPIFTYGVAGDGTVCGDVTFTGGSMDSWDSTGGGTYAGTHQNSGGSIGTNGNVTLSGGSTRVHGPIYNSSNTNVGGCPNGITNNVGGTPWDSLNSTAPLVYPNPAVPSPMTPTTNLNVNSNTCWGAVPAGCTAVAAAGLVPAHVNVVPGSYGDITSNSNLHLSAGTYYINSLNLNGGTLTLDSTPVVINLGGNGVSSGGTLFASQSSTLINDGGVPSNLQIVTACCTTGTPPVQMANPPVITMNGSSAMFAVVYAPNSYVHITGSSQFLGAVVGQKVTSDSSGGFSYDRGLQRSLLRVGNFQPVSYTWNKQ
jgi:Tfp pilus assembly protein PilX